MKNKKQPEYILFRESFIQSILTEMSSYCFLLFTFWFNYRYIGNNGFIDFILLILFFILVFAQASSKQNKFYSKEDFKDYVNKL